MMHYVAIIGEQERQVEITEVAGGKYKLVMDGRTMQLDVRPVSDTTLSLLHDNQAYNIESEEDPSGHGQNVLVRGHVINVEVVDLRTLRLRKAQEVVGGPDGPAEITAPMSGKLVDILVEEGQEVDEGQGLLVVEAMKMENELRSPRKGVVKNLTAQKGAAVDGGAALCIVE